MKLFDTKIAFGLDISDRDLRLIQLARHGQKITVHSYNELALSPDCIKNGEIINQKSFIVALKKITSSSLGSRSLSEKVIAVLPEEKTFLKVISLPDGDQDIESGIKENLPLHIPINLDDSYFDFQILDDKGDSKSVLVGTAPKITVDSYTEALKRSGLLPVAMEIEATAISRCLINSPVANKQQIIIDLGANRTGLFLYENGVVKFTVSLDISGNQITEEISQKMTLDIEEAEKAKNIYGLDQDQAHGAIFEIITTHIDKLIEQIKRAIIFYESNFSAKSDIEKIILCGGGANILNLAPLLSQKLNLKVEISDPWIKISNPDANYFSPAKSQSFTTALGLALRGLDYENYNS